MPGAASRFAFEDPSTPMPPWYSIAPARQKDLPRLASIELAAARLLVGYAPESVLRETTSQHELRDALSKGLLWVALANDDPVGFAHIELLEPTVAHLKELDVHPSHGRRGLGTKLIETVCEWAAAANYGWVTLTTFREAPWNMPFYAKVGFEEIPRQELTSVLLSILREEGDRGLDPARRVAMRRRCSI